MRIFQDDPFLLLLFVVDVSIRRIKSKKIIIFEKEKRNTKITKRTVSWKVELCHIILSNLHLRFILSHLILLSHVLFYFSDTLAPTTPCLFYLNLSLKIHSCTSLYIYSPKSLNPFTSINSLLSPLSFLSHTYEDEVIHFVTQQ